MASCPDKKPISTASQPKLPREVAEHKVASIDSLPAQISYSWAPQFQAIDCVVHQILPPEGYERVTVKENSFGEWLRFLPLQESDAKVYLFNGQLKSNQNAHCRVIDIDIGKNDLQQCADAVMRLKAEYHFSRQEYKRIHFNFTSGHRVNYTDWQKGKRPIIQGNQVTFSIPNSPVDTSYKGFRKYMRTIFSYAGTYSLQKELQRVSIDNIRIGDVFIQGGFPGHAVLVMDIAKNETGETMFLLAQSYMPAQNIHILKNPASSSPWYPPPKNGILITPEWHFQTTDLHRFKSEENDS